MPVLCCGRPLPGRRFRPADLGGMPAGGPGELPFGPSARLDRADAGLHVGERFEELASAADAFRKGFLSVRRDEDASGHTRPGVRVGQGPVSGRAGTEPDDLGRRRGPAAERGGTCRSRCAERTGGGEPLCFARPREPALFRHFADRHQAGAKCVVAGTTGAEL